MKHSFSKPPRYVGNIGSLLNSIYVRDKLPKESVKIKSSVKRLTKELNLYLKSGVLPTFDSLMAKYRLGQVETKKLLTAIKRRLKRNATTSDTSAKKTQVTGSTLPQVEPMLDELVAGHESPSKVTVSLKVQQMLRDIRNKYGEEIKQRGEQTSIPEGFVYLVTRCLFDGWVKAGMTIDYEQRLITYNVSDPISRFQFSAVKWVSNRRNAERDLLARLEGAAVERRGEWFFIRHELAVNLFGSEEA
jgi:hypothetical protein